ncbi:EAL domain-containing protein [Shewanella sp. HN-41]|uniref:EAL domain-containing protein n=1 Tax=Shewanella sp. HN-41 TaxID=327275 RepID=UPI000212696D|nr:EAL domain-containing protein [Shewanella sp. HN-41]EGM70275.1 diguanylate cyclase/phosphodiesterase (GGDEF & EAL domain) with PAS/PAC sensor(s) [Shewanella sp. HN-41]
MHNFSRFQFVVLAVASYALLALGWIYFSDQLLLFMTDQETVFRFSLAKGIFFVFTSALVFTYVLNAVPDRHIAPSHSAIELTFSHSILLGQSLWFSYCVAVLLPLLTLWFVQYLPLELQTRLLLLIFTLPISLSAIIGGFGPGLLTTFISTLSVYLLTINADKPQNEMIFTWLPIVSLSINGIIISGLSGYLRASLRKSDLNHQLLESMVSQTTDAIFVKDLQGRYVMANQRAAAFVGKSTKEMIGQNDEALFEPASAALIRVKDERVLKDKGVTTHKEHLLLSTGPAVFQVTKGPVMDSKGLVRGLFGIARDITAQEQSAERLRQSETSLKQAQQLSGIGSWEWDTVTNTHTWSEQVFAIYGLTPKKALDFEQLQSLFTPESWQKLNQAAMRCLETGDPYECEAELVETETSVSAWIMVRGQATLDEQGKVIKLHGTVQDITQSRMLQQQIAAQTALLQRVIQGSEQGYWDWNVATGEVQVSQKFEAILGYSAGEIQLTVHNWTHFVHEDDWADVKRIVRQHLRHRSASIELEVRCKKKSGNFCWVLCKGRVVEVDGRGRPLMISGTQADITQLKNHEAELDRVANYDVLTGLPNRRLLLDRFNQAISRVNRNGSLCAVCFLDLDGFKVVNDQYGHDVGDQLLIAIVEHLSYIMREQDTLARVGGDEFVALFEIDSETEGTQVLERMLGAINQTIYIGDKPLRLTASIGVSLYPEDNVDPDILLRHADHAMYMAKAAGKNCFQMFDHDVERKVIAKRQWLEELKAAFAKREFVLFYQPKVNLATGEVIGAEALIRWLHPQRGILLPSAFLPDIEGSELEIPLGEWVINTALAQLQAWHKEGRNIKVSVNVSARQLLADHFYDFLKQTLTDHPDVPASALELEILESAAIKDMALAIAILNECVSLGVHFSLDDFGTGYSSLTYLRKLPISTLKIDQSFVRDMLEDQDDLRIVEGVVRLATVFNLAAIAEGVESIAHGIKLAELGCQMCQGYGIAHPMYADDFINWYENWPLQHAQMQLGLMHIAEPISVNSRFK